MCLVLQTNSHQWPREVSDFDASPTLVKTWFALPPAQKSTESKLNKNKFTLNFKIAFASM